MGPASESSGMWLIQVYTEPLRRRHYASVWGSAAAWYRFLGMVAAIVLAYIVAYATGGFWSKYASYYEQPAVRFTHDALLVVEVRLGASPPASRERLVCWVCCPRPSTTSPRAPLIAADGALRCGCLL